MRALLREQFGLGPLGLLLVTPLLLLALVFGKWALEMAFAAATNPALLVPAAAEAAGALTALHLVRHVYRLVPCQEAAL